ncbi:MAG: hypothetical protein KH050_01350 [Clostridiaceae bacterium]|nr:hypothetical protein [Clostridiaceae bacterium]
MDFKIFTFTFCAVFALILILQSIQKTKANARTRWIGFCIAWVLTLAFAPLVCPAARSILWDREHIGVEYAYIKGNFSNDSHGTGQAVFQMETDSNWNITFDKLNSTLFWYFMPPESGKITVMPTFTAGTASLKITQGGESFAIQKVPLTSGEEVSVDISAWNPREEIVLWLVVSHGENGNITVTPVK